MPKILTIDDSSMARRMNRAILEQAGYDVLEADGPDQGLEKVQLEQPDLVLLDLLMPGVEEETEIVKHIRALAPHIPIVIVSSNIQEAVRTAVVAAGASGFLPKPVKSAQLLPEVQRVLGDESGITHTA